jgi:Fe-S cluster assembly protein SufD
MLQVSAERELYLAHFAELSRARQGKEPFWVQALRQAALSRFLALGFPGTDLEEWRFTNVAPIARFPWELALASGGRPDEESREVGRFSFEESWAGQAHPAWLDSPIHRIVFIDGQYAPEFSSQQPLPRGVALESLRAILEKQPQRLEPRLARYVNYQEAPFAALNTAFFTDGAVVYLEKGVVLDEPIHLLFLASGARPTVAHPRNLVVAAANSQARIVESYAGPEGRSYFTNAVTELVAAENAVVEHYQLERESEAAYHVAYLQIEQGPSSNVTSFSISLGGALVRNDINVVLDGEGACSTLNGLYVGTGAQHIDNHTRIDHVQPHGTSREYYKGILDQSAQGVFNGRIIVRPGAQKTDARQTNKNLLLSEKALANSNPQLEIFADDVKCTHGATIGHLDADAIFYLRSRGLSLEAARSLLTYAFLNDIQTRIRIDPIRVELERDVFRKLAESQEVGEPS